MNTRTPFCTCPSCQGTQVKDEPCVQLRISPGSMKPYLSPCPFCAGAPVLEDHRLLWAVRCQCGASMLGERAPEPHGNGESSDAIQDAQALAMVEATDWEHYRLTAVNAWNKRAATIELPCQPVEDLTTRLQKAMWAGVSIRISSDPLGAQLSALIVEMAGHEAEAYALQDRVDEANASVTALEQRVAELEAQNKKLSQDFASTVDHMNEGCICGRAPAPKKPVDPRLLRK